MVMYREPAKSRKMGVICIATTEAYRVSGVLDSCSLPAKMYFQGSTWDLVSGHVPKRVNPPTLGVSPAQFGHLQALQRRRISTSMPLMLAS